jgi:hypothetical protein
LAVEQNPGRKRRRRGQPRPVDVGTKLIEYRSVWEFVHADKLRFKKSTDLAEPVILKAGDEGDVSLPLPSMRSLSTKIV